MEKNKRIYEGLLKWRENKGKGTLNYTMRFGKTLVGITLIQNSLKYNPNNTINIIVPSLAIKDYWKMRLSNVFNEKELKQLKVFSAYEYLNNPSECTILVIDEIHKFLSGERVKIFESSYKFILGLSGTVIDCETLRKYCPIIDRISEKEAIENDWINEFLEYNLKLELSEEDKIKYEEYSSPITRIRETYKDCNKVFFNTKNELLFKDINALLFACYSGVTVDGHYIKSNIIRDELARRKGWTNTLDMRYEYNQTLDSIYNPEIIRDNAILYSRLVSARKELIDTAYPKYDTVLSIDERFKVKTICFSETVAMAERIALGIEGAIPYHSNLQTTPIIDKETKDYIRYKNGNIRYFGKDSLRKLYIDGMNSGEYRFLSTVKSLDEGVNIPSLEMVITTSGSTNPIQYAQRVARCKSKYEGKISKIINLYFDDFVSINGNEIKSRDKQKLLQRQALSDNSVMWIDSLDEIC